MDYLDYTEIDIIFANIIKMFYEKTTLNFLYKISYIELYK